MGFTFSHITTPAHEIPKIPAQQQLCWVCTTWSSSDRRRGALVIHSLLRILSPLLARLSFVKNKKIKISSSLKFWFCPTPRFQLPVSLKLLLAEAREEIMKATKIRTKLKKSRKLTRTNSKECSARHLNFMAFYFSVDGIWYIRIPWEKPHWLAQNAQNSAKSQMWDFCGEAGNEI